MLSYSRFITRDQVPLLDTPDGYHHQTWTDPTDQQWPYRCRSSGEGSSRLPVEILLQIVLNIPQVFSSQDLKHLALVNTFWSNFARLCRFYYVDDQSKAFKLLQEISRSTASPPGRLLCISECVHHLRITINKKDTNTNLTDMVVRLPNLRQLAIKNFHFTIVAITTSEMIPLQVIDLSAIRQASSISTLEPMSWLRKVARTLSQSQSNLELFHLEFTPSLEAPLTLANASSFDAIRSLRLFRMRFYSSSRDLNRTLYILSKLHHLEHIYLDYQHAHFTHAYKLWQPPHEYIMEVFRGSRLKELRMTGSWTGNYLCPKLWRLRREYNAAHLETDRASRPPPEDLLRTWLCNLMERYASNLPSLELLCIAGMSLTVHRRDSGEVGAQIDGDSAEWTFLRGVPQELFLASREWRKDQRKQRQLQKL